MLRLSREKIVRMSHQVTDVLVSSDEVDIVDDRDTIRQQIVQIIRKKSSWKFASASARRKKRKSWKAVKSGTCYTASITRTSFAVWALRPRPTTVSDPRSGAKPLT